MDLLNKEVSFLPKIGPKFKKLLENLDILTVENLLYHFPFRYEDLSNIKPIAELEPGETVTVRGKLEKIENIFTKNRKRLTMAQISDMTGTIEAIWFNQHWLKKSMRVGEEYQFSGKADKFNNKLSLISPEHELGANSLHTGRLVPIYPETAGISSKYLRTRINDVLCREKNFEEFLPKITLIKHKLESLDKALRTIHFPDSLIEANLARRRFEFEELFMELIKVEMRKNEWNNNLKGCSLEKIKLKEKLNDYIHILPFKLTDSQKEAVDETLQDMTHEHPMNRLLEGDVGTGKTVVAIIAAYFTYLNGYKTVYMAPTEILANQHYETFNKLLASTGLKIFLMTGNRKDEGTGWDVLIGTHALLYGNKKYEKTGLIVIDEQHRFGVEQRARLLDFGNDGAVPHLLTMTATPIPRTLALTLFGDLSISTLKTAPNIGKKITTKVVPSGQRQEAYELIKKKGEPTFIVCPLIEESESTSLENVKAAEVEYETLRKGVFAGTTVGLLHGRMKPKEKQEIMQKFKNGEIKILVSTPVIEVGIDVPEATIMVIESAERYGLASLHQLRGRVGRGDKPGICLVFMSNNSRAGYERLKNLEKISNGMELAEIDMKNRGQGDIYGIMQHGFRTFKVADINNLRMLEAAKKEAQDILIELDRYPLLKEKLYRKNGKLVGKN